MTKFKAEIRRYYALVKGAKHGEVQVCQIRKLNPTEACILQSGEEIVEDEIARDRSDTYLDYKTPGAMARAMLVEDPESYGLAQ